MRRAQGFALGVGSTLGAIALLNARVLMFAAGYERMRRDLPALFDSHEAAASVQICLDEYELD